MTEKLNTSRQSPVLNGHLSAIAELVTSTVYNLKWHHFDILARGKSNTDCKIKEALLIRDLKPALNENISCHIYFFFPSR